MARIQRVFEREIIIHRYLFALIIRIYISANRARRWEPAISPRSPRNSFSALSKNYIDSICGIFISPFFFSRYRDVCVHTYRSTTAAKCATALRQSTGDLRRFSREFEGDRSSSEILQYHAASRELGYMIDDFPIAAPHCSDP